MTVRHVFLASLCFALALASQTQAQARILPHPGTTVSGTVTSVNGSILTLFDGRITLDASRALVRSELGSLLVSDIKPGDRISAFVQVSPTGAWMAEMIHVLRTPDALIAGAAEAVDANAGTITLLGQQVRVTPNTVIRGLGGAAVQLRDILPRQQVRIELDAAQPGLVAKTIIVTSPVPDIRSSFVGIVEKIEGDTWTFRSGDETVVVKVTSETNVAGTPRVGDKVVVMYKTDTAGQKLAIAIGPVPSIPRPDRPIDGHVTELTATSLTIRRGNGESVTFTVNDQTQFFGGRPAVGDRVLVFSREAEGGGRVATRVVRADSVTENRITFSGTLRSIEGNRWVIDGQVVLVSSRTRFVGDPKVGDKVHVIATQTPDRTLHALEIAKMP